MEIRFTAWLLWRIHLAFRQMGVGGGMGAQFALAFLKSLPFGLVLELAEASQESFTWLAEHFPDVARENPGLERQGTFSAFSTLSAMHGRASLKGMVASTEAFGGYLEVSGGWQSTNLKAVKTCPVAFLVQAGSIAGFIHQHCAQVLCCAYKFTWVTWWYYLG